MKRSIADAARVCWNMTDLAESPPRHRQYEAFFSLVDLLLPSLRKTEWPKDPEFGFVAKEWPGIRGHNGLFRQYRTLAARLRSAARFPKCAQTLWKVLDVSVSHVSCATRWLREVSQTFKARPVPSISLHLSDVAAALALSDRRVGGGGRHFCCGFFQDKVRQPSLPRLRQETQ